MVPLYAGILDSLAPAHRAGEVDALPEIRNELPALQNRFSRQVTVTESPSSSVADPDPLDARVFRPFGSGPASISQRYGSGSGSLYH